MKSGAKPFIDGRGETAGMTIVLATHEMAFGREVADRLVFMAHGRIRDEGSPEQLLTASQSPIRQSSSPVTATERIHA